MNKADSIYLGKLFVDYAEAIESTQKEIGSTTDMMEAVIEGLGVHDGRPDEVLEYKVCLNKLIAYAQTRGISSYELIELGGEYKKISFIDFLSLKSNLTIKDELDKLLEK